MALEKWKPAMKFERKSAKVDLVQFFVPMTRE